eukprot:bmy_06095T0
MAYPTTKRREATVFAPVFANTRILPPPAAPASSENRNSRGFSFLNQEPRVFPPPHRTTRGTRGARPPPPEAAERSARFFLPALSARGLPCAPCWRASRSRAPPSLSATGVAVPPARLQVSGAMFPLLLVLLTGLGELHGGRNPHKTFLQTTVPEKISTSEAIKDPEYNVAYIITIEGKPYFIHLKKQSFLSSASVVYSYDKDDTQHSQPLLAQMDCNYHGYVAGFPNSLVSLNICSGLRGILQFKNISYGIEPMEAVSGFMHMIHEEKNDITNIPLLRENDTYIYDSSQYQVRKSSEFDYMGSDVKGVTQKVIQIIGFVNTMLTQLKLTSLLSVLLQPKPQERLSAIVQVFVTIVNPPENNVSLLRTNV